MSNTSNKGLGLIEEPLVLSLEVYNCKGRPMVVLKKTIYELEKIKQLIKSAFEKKELLATIQIKDKFFAHQKIKMIELQTKTSLFSIPVK